MARRERTNDDQIIEDDLALFPAHPQDERDEHRTGTADDTELLPDQAPSGSSTVAFGEIDEVAPSDLAAGWRERRPRSFATAARPGIDGDVPLSSPRTDPAFSAPGDAREPTPVAQRPFTDALTGARAPIPWRALLALVVTILAAGAAYALTQSGGPAAAPRTAAHELPGNAVEPAPARRRTTHARPAPIRPAEHRSPRRARRHARTRHERPRPRKARPAVAAAPSPRVTHPARPAVAPAAPAGSAGATVVHSAGSAPARGASSGQVEATFGVGR